VPPISALLLATVLHLISSAVCGPSALAAVKGSSPAGEDLKNKNPGAKCEQESLC
jgi:hypothetical protein